MIHDRVDIDHWRSLFPLRNERECSDHLTATSPCHIATIEQLRQKALTGMGQDQAVQAISVTTDAFVFSEGEPERRDVTKIGGLPFWPRGRKWPELSRGRPATFVGQMCFGDSLDIVSSLPSYMLLVFGDIDSPGALPKGLDFYWINTNTTDLVAASDIPEMGMRVAPCYGSIHRTVDYGKWFFNDHGLDSNLAVIEGTKIGGIPPWIRPPANPPGRFLCSLGSIQPEQGRQFPWLNVPESNESPEEGLLTWGNAGILYLFVDNRGRIQWTVQSR